MNRDNPFGMADVFSPSGWKPASACGPDGGNCVEVNFSVAGLVAVRDSKPPRSPILVFDDHEWRSFLTAAHAGQYDPPTRTQ
ncbi:MAG: DUF397 domain-containing protein [Pseudonocardiaceae bacterium]